MKHIFDDADKNKYEAYTKEEVLEVIQEAISSGELPEEINGLVLTFKNPVDNQAYKIAFCTQAKYNELVAAGQIEENCYYHIVDDTTFEDLENAIATLRTGVNQHTSEIEDIKQDITEIESNITSLDGRVDTLEGIHLYRHDIEITRVNGGAYLVVFSLYLARSTAMTSLNDILEHIGLNARLNAGGYYLDSSTSDVGGVNYAYTLSVEGELNINYSRIQNGELDIFNGSFNNNTAVVVDKIHQIF